MDIPTRLEALSKHYENYWSEFRSEAMAKRTAGVMGEAAAELRLMIEAFRRIEELTSKRQLPLTAEINGIARGILVKYPKEESC